MLINVHAITTLFGKIRCQITGYCLFKGLHMDHLKDLFNDNLGMERYDFGWKEFLKIYHDHTGFSNSIYSEK